MYDFFFFCETLGEKVVDKSSMKNNDAYDLVFAVAIILFAEKCVSINKFLFFYFTISNFCSVCLDNMILMLLVWVQLLF